MVSVTLQTFPDVEVYVPAQQSGEANFVMLTTGCLQVDEDFEITLHVDQPKRGVVEPMKLGILSKASAVCEDDTGRYLDVQTNNRGAVTVYRLVFRSAGVAHSVAGLAEKAMQEEFNTWEVSTAARSAEHNNLLHAVKNSLSGCRPLLFDGVQLFGVDPLGDVDEAGSEVLLGEGILALLDPNWQGDDARTAAATNSIGKYELLFFSQEEGAHTPIRRFLIAPKMTLQIQDRERAEIDDEEEPAVSFSLSISGDVFTFAFDCIDVAQAFERDFTVRQRLMTVALSTAKKTHEITKLQKGPLQMRLERAVHIGLAIPAVVLLLAFQSQAVSSSLCYLFCQ